MLERARMTREEWRAAQEAIERKQREQSDAEHSASAATIMLEDELERLPSDSSERRTWIRILETLRADPVAIYRLCKANDEKFAAAWVHAGRELERRVHIRLAELIMQMGSEATDEA